MRPSERLRKHCDQDWAAIVGHRFCAGLADGTLAEAKMAWYLVQDYSFIDGFVRLAASAIATAPSLADSVPLAQFLAVIAGPENTYFQRSFEALGVPDRDRVEPELAPATRAFRGLMAEAAASGRYGRMIAVLTVAEWSYLAWAATHAPPRAGLPFHFAEWIELHAGPGFEAVVEYLRGQLDRAWERAGAEERELMERDFREAVRLERAFFDAAWSAA